MGEGVCMCVRACVRFCHQELLKVDCMATAGHGHGGCTATVCVCVHTSSAFIDAVRWKPCITKP